MWTAPILAVLGEPADGLPDVPFPAIHHWHAAAVAPLLAGAGLPDVPRWQRLHERALAGSTAGADEWAATLRPVLLEVYRRCYRYERAYAVAHASAEAYAVANGFDDGERVEFAKSYAAMNTDANVASFATANAMAHAEAMARAFANEDLAEFAGSYPFARMRAYAAAAATAEDDELRRLARAFVTSVRLWSTRG